MSSVVKKSSHFTPKIKKQAPRRRQAVSSKSPSVTPQLNEDIRYDISIEKRTESEDKSSPFESSRIDPKGSISDAEGRDPKAKSEVISDEQGDKSDRDIIQNRDEEEEKDGEEKEDEDYGDNDIFRENPDPNFSGNSSGGIGKRRLSGISSGVVRRPSVRSSVGFTGVSPLEIPDSNNASQPTKITIPLTKPPKRRTLVPHNNQPTKKSLVMNASVLVKPEDKKLSAALTETESEDSSRSSTGYVMGIDPRTNKLRKFKAEEVSDSNASNASINLEDRILDSNVSSSSSLESIPVAPRNLQTRITSIKQLPRRLDESDLHLLANVGVHVESITMADLCKPSLPIGEISQNYLLVKEAQEKLRKQKLRKRIVRMKARNERRTIEEIMNDHDKEEAAHTSAQDEQSNVGSATKEPSGIKLSMQNGNIVVDEGSTVVNRHRNHDRGNRVIEQSNPFENPITSSTYSKRKHTDRWTPEELKVFYNALSTWGTDFTFIAQLFPYRTRKQIKLKYNLEEKKYPEIVEMALKRKLPADFDKYCDCSNNKIETLEYYNEELKKLRHKHEEHMNLIIEERQKAIQQDAENSRKREVEIRTGSKSMSRSEKLKELRKNEMVVGTIDQVKQDVDNDQQ